MPAGLDGNPNPIRSDTRDALLHQIVMKIGAINPKPNVLVGVDGASGTGKSTLADEQTNRLQDIGRSVVRSTIDSFHNARTQRYKRGRHSPEGYYLDSHNLRDLMKLLIDPFSRGEPFKVTCFDEPSDSALDIPFEEAPTESILLFDGLFLHRPELRGYWDYSIFLTAEDRLAMHRTERASTDPSETVAASNRRYVDGWLFYLAERNPSVLANEVIDNNDLSAPFFIGRN